MEDQDMDTGHSGRDMEDWDRDMRDMGTPRPGRGTWRDWETDPGKQGRDVRGLK